MSVPKNIERQLNERGLALDADNNIVEIESPSAVIRVLKDGAEEGAEIGKKVARGTATGAKVVGENLVYGVVDVPVEAVKATGRGFKRLGRAMSEGHQNRLESKAERREARKAAREERKAEAEKAAAEAHAEAAAEAKNKARSHARKAQAS